ncbi:MAG: sensor histidine kinase [Acidobacteriota bacterium]
MPTAIVLIVGDAVSPALRLATTPTSASIIAGLGLTFGIWIATGLYFGRRIKLLERWALDEATRAREDERQALARELHDDIGQMLTAIKVELAVAQRELREHGAPPVLDDVKPLADRALQSVRDWSHALHPATLDERGLVGAVAWFVERVCTRAAIGVSFSHTGLTVRLSSDIEMAAYRIVQESIANIIKHANAGSVQITIARDDRLRVVIEDDGVGFVTDRVIPRGGPAGLGLISMRERASQLGGTLTIASAPGIGTRVIAILPLTIQRHDDRLMGGAFSRGLVGAAR